MKNRRTKKLLSLFILIDLAFLVYLSFQQSSPHRINESAAEWNSMCNDGVFFITGVLMGPLILKGISHE